MLKRMMLAAALFVAAGSVQALEVSPLVATFTPNHRAGTLTINNTDGVEKTYQVFVDEWAVENGEKVRRPSNAIRFAPAVVTIPANGTQTVRYIHSRASADEEKAYRIKVQEIQSGVVSTQTGVVFAMAMDFPWFWRGATMKPQLEARWDGQDLLVKNTGNATAQLVNLQVGDYQRTGLVGYVLPQEEARFEAKDVKVRSANISLLINGTATEMPVL